MADLDAIEDLLIGLFLEVHETPPAEIILDRDPTDSPVHGEQWGRHFQAHYDEYCFLPLYVFCGEYLLAARLRPGDVAATAKASAGRGRDEQTCAARASAKQLAESAKQAQQTARQAARSADGAEKEAGKLRGRASAARRQADWAAEQATWQGKSNVRFVVTNVAIVTMAAQALYEQGYCPRGDMENRIKEQQLYLFAELAAR